MSRGRTRFGRTATAAACVLAIVTVAGCGSGGESQDEALTSLRLTTEAARLQGEMGKLVGSLGSDPSPARQASVGRRLASLDREAAELIAAAGADSTYEVTLRPLNGGRGVGVATLVENDGKVAMQGTVRGLPGGDHPVAIYALGAGEGRSVCPPRDAAAGGDGVLSPREAAVFFGRPAVALGSVPGGSQREMSFERPSRRSPPLDVRALVVAGGSFEGGYRSDLPIACGVPVAVRSRGASSSRELVAAVDQTRAAGVEISSVVGDSTSAAATAARSRAEAHLGSAARHLAAADRAATQELHEAGEASTEARRAAAKATAAIGESQVAVKGGFARLKARVEREQREERRRLTQRRAAQKAAARKEAAETKAAHTAERNPESGAVTEPEASSEPEFIPESEPAPAPEPATPEGPTIVSP